MSSKHYLSFALGFVVLLAFAHAGCGGGNAATTGGDDAGTDGGDDASAGDDAAGHTCGNGVIEAPEECDNGPGKNVNGSGCENDCTFTCIAGNPMRDHCDDGNACNGTETCTSMHKCQPGTPLANGAMCGMGKVCTGGNCTAGVCGDGIVEAGEECDDGNSVNGDGCDNTCKFSCLSTDTMRNCTPMDACKGQGTCNDTTHVCAAGTPLMDGASCGTMGQVCKMATCVSAACGDGIVETGEDCDFGMANGMGTGCEINCKFSCTLNPNSCVTQDLCAGTNTCTAVMVSGHAGQKCVVGTPPPNGTVCPNSGMCTNGVCVTALCGNGVVNTGEQCDFGAGNGPGTGCERDCTFSCTINPNSCMPSDRCAAMPLQCAANMVMGHAGQKCGPATALANCAVCGTGALCSMNGCHTSTCGDGCVDAARGETCEPPNTSTCDAMCHRIVVAVCGNGTIEGTEQCDDGNRRDLDGCDSSCKYEVIGRMTSVVIQGTTAPPACTPTTNALGTRAVTNTALGILNNSLTTGINAGTTNVMTYFMGLDDLTGVSDPNGLQIGVLSGSLDPAKGMWPMTNPIDWWFFATGSTVSMGLPTGILTNGTLAARQLAAGPSDVSLTLLLAGSPALLEMRAARIAATLNGTPPPNVPAPPPAQLASGLTVFQTFTGSGTNQGLCGNITVESLAQIPIPQQLATGGSNACGSCGGSHTYTYCGMGMPVGPSCNSLLDALVGGCKVVLCLVGAINPTQPDVPAGMTVNPLSIGAGNKVPANQSTGNKDAYSSYMKFDGNRAHFTSQTCVMTSDCQAGLTCQTGVCK